MWLPAGTIRALQRHPDAIFQLAIASLAFGALALHASGWATIIVSALTLAVYDRRRSAAEAHERLMAERSVEVSVAKVQSVKVKHMDLLTYIQPDLPLGTTPAPDAKKKRRGK